MPSAVHTKPSLTPSLDQLASAADDAYGTATHALGLLIQHASAETHAVRGGTTGYEHDAWQQTEQLLIDARQAVEVLHTYVEAAEASRRPKGGAR